MKFNKLVVHTTINAINIEILSITVEYNLLNQSSDLLPTLNEEQNQN